MKQSFESYLESLLIEAGEFNEHGVTKETIESDMEGWLNELDPSEWIELAEDWSMSQEKINNSKNK